MDENEETEQNTTSGCKQSVGKVLHNKKFHSIILALILIDAVLVLFMLLIDLDVIPMKGESSEEKHNNKEKVEHSLHYAGLSLLCIFVVEIVLLIYIDGVDFFKQKLNIFDAAIVFLSLILDIALTFSPVSNAVRDAVILMILLRLWRFFKLICAINICVRKDVRDELEKERRARKIAEEERDQYKLMVEQMKNNS